MLFSISKFLKHLTWSHQNVQYCIGTRSLCCILHASWSDEGLKFTLLALHTALTLYTELCFVSVGNGGGALGSGTLCGPALLGQSAGGSGLPAS